jgi:hypothetical protein
MKIDLIVVMYVGAIKLGGVETEKAAVVLGVKRDVGKCNFFFRKDLFVSDGRRNA